MDAVRLPSLILILSFWGVNSSIQRKFISCVVTPSMCNLRQEYMINYHLTSFRFCQFKSDTQTATRATDNRTKMMNDACSRRSIKTCSQSNGLICVAGASAKKREKHGENQRYSRATTDITLNAGGQTTKHSTNSLKRHGKTTNHFQIYPNKALDKEATNSKHVRVTKTKDVGKSTRQIDFTQSSYRGRKDKREKDVLVQPINAGSVDTMAKLVMFGKPKPTDILLTGTKYDNFDEIMSLTYIAKSKIVLFFPVMSGALMFSFMQSKIRRFLPVTEHQATHYTVAVAQRQIFFLFYPNGLATMSLFCKNIKFIRTMRAPKSMVVDIRQRLLFLSQNWGIMVYNYKGVEKDHIKLHNPNIQLYIEPFGKWLYYVKERQNIFNRMPLKYRKSGFYSRFSINIESVCIFRGNFYVRTGHACTVHRTINNDHASKFDISIQQDRFSCFWCQILQICSSRENVMDFIDFEWHRYGY